MDLVPPGVRALAALGAALFFLVSCGAGSGPSSASETCDPTPVLIEEESVEGYEVYGPPECALGPDDVRARIEFPELDDTIPCTQIWVEGLQLPEGFRGCAGLDGHGTMQFAVGCDDPDLDGAYTDGRGLYANAGEIIRAASCK